MLKRIPIRWRLAAAFAVCMAALLLALGALVFGRFCLGSAIYYLLTGQGAFARATMPWAREEAKTGL